MRPCEKGASTMKYGPITGSIYGRQDMAAFFEAAANSLKEAGPMKLSDRLATRTERLHYASAQLYAWANAYYRLSGGRVDRTYKLVVDKADCIEESLKPAIQRMERYP